MDILIGADPELFVKKDGKFHSAYDLVPGNKKSPYPVENGNFQVDGMALEINPSPAKKEEEFIHNVESVLSSLRGMLPEEYTFDFTVTAIFDKDHFLAQPREALEIGCEADFDAYEGTQKQQPILIPHTRTAGGHIHIGWTEDEDPMESSHFLSCCQMAKQLDYFLGIPSVILDHDRTRNKIYGQAGSFRPKPYGMEYRVLSNFWITDKEYMKFVFRQTKKAFTYLVETNMEYFRHYEMHARDYINKKDVGGASLFLSNVDEIIEPYTMEQLQTMGKK